MFTSWYEVLVSEYAENHFIKKFSKKYKTTWQETFDQIINILSHIDRFILTAKAEKIHICDFWYIAKCEFKIAWSNDSAKTSWNRIIVFVDEERKTVEILLVYSKNDVLWSHETVWWKQEIKNNFDWIYDLFKY